MAEHLFDTPPPAARHRIHYAPGPLQFGDLRLPESGGPHPLLVVIHGGFWRARYDLTHVGHMCHALAAEGFATWSLEYRRIGDRGGGWPGTFIDIGLGTDYVQELPLRFSVDLDRVVIVGHSAGGHLALWAAGRHKIPPHDHLYVRNPFIPKAAVGLAAVSSLSMAWDLGLSSNAVVELMGAPPTEARDRYRTASPVEMLPLGVRQVLVHGTDDDDVPYRLSEAYHSAAVAAGDDVELVPLRGVGHFELIDPRMKDWRRVLEVLKREA